MGMFGGVFFGGGGGCATPQVTFRSPAVTTSCDPRWGRSEGCSGYGMPFFLLPFGRDRWFALAQDFCYARHNSSKLDLTLLKLLSFRNRSKLHFIHLNAIFCSRL